MYKYYVVMSHYKDDITVTTQNRGGAEVQCNNNDIIRVTEHKWLLSQIRQKLVTMQQLHSWLLSALVIIAA